MNIDNFEDKNSYRNSVQFSSYVFNFYSVFCSFGYYTFLIPYRFTLIENGYEIYTNKIRKVLCFIVHFCILVLGVGNLRKKFSVPKLVDRPKQFFIMAEGVCLFSYNLVFIHMILSKQSVLIDMMRRSLKCNDRKRSKKYQRIAIIMHLLAIFSCAAHLFADTFYGHGTLKNLIGTNAGKFYYGFHLKDSDIPFEEKDITLTTIFFTLFCFVVKICLRLLSHYTELSFYIGAIAIGLIIKDFLSILSHNASISIQNIIECYEDMKLLISNINSICGGFIVIVFVASIPHFARDSIAFFDTSDWWMKLDYMQYAILYLTSLTYAAEATNNGQNQCFKKLAVPVDILSNSTAVEVVVENLEICVDVVNEYNRVLANADIQIGARDEGVNQAVNENFEKNLSPPDISKEHLGFAYAFREPYLTDDVEDNEIYHNNNKPVTNATDNVPSKNVFDSNDVLVPKVRPIPDPACENTENTDRKSNVRTTNYDPVARRARYQATRIKFLTKKLRDSEKLKQSKILDYLEKKLDVNQMTLVRMQIKNAGRKPRGHRFTFEEKCMAFAVYKQSPKCYRRLLSKILTLPCKQTLMQHSALVRFEAGINPTLMTFLSDVVKDMKETDKIVTLGWDEMSLNAHLDFCKVKDYIDGFVDDGKKTSDEFATHALVFMVRGVHKSYKQPISYFFTQNICKDELAELIILVIEAVMDVGLKVVGSVCDAVSTNLAAVRTLMDPKLARLPKVCMNSLEYQVRKASIIHYFDPPHLIKSIRNNMLTKDLHHYVALKKPIGRKTDQINWNNQNKVERVASWDDVTEFYKDNLKGINQLLENITDEHIEPKKKKMKVINAVQVFSRTFGTTMRYCSEKKQLPRDFTGTADILLFFNEVFDSLNGDGVPSVNISLKGSVHQQSYHFTFWKYAVEMLKKMRFVPKDRETQERSRVLHDYILTINGLVELTNRLFDLKTESVSIRMMTQDALENFFGGIRSYCQAAVCPTPRNFRNAYATSLFNNLSSSHSIKSNCEEDGGIPLIQDLFLKFMNEKSTKKPDADIEQHLPESDDDTTNGPLKRELSTAEIEAKNYFAGHVCKIILRKNQCPDCEKSISSRGNNQKYHGLITARAQYSATGNQLLMYPKPKFIDCFKKLTSTLEQLVPSYCSQKSLTKTIIQAIGTDECFAGCNLHKTEFTKEFTKLTSEILITAFTTKVNNLLSDRLQVLTEPYDNIQEAAFNFRQKKKHIGKYAASDK